MNFNISSKPEYNLYRDTSDEFIRLYGLECNYIITTKQNKDFIFGEYSHLKVDGDKVFKISLKLSNDETFGNGNMFSKFGLQNLDTTEAIISSKTMDTIHPNISNLNGSGWDEIIGNLIVFPSGKIMEVTSFNPEVQGINNLFPYSDKKNVYQLTLKQYVNNRDEIAQEVKDEMPSFTNLEEIFGVDIEKKENIETNELNKRVKYDSVFGDLG